MNEIELFTTATATAARTPDRVDGLLRDFVGVPEPRQPATPHSPRSSSTRLPVYFEATQPDGTQVRVACPEGLDADTAAAVSRVLTGR